MSTQLSLLTLLVLALPAPLVASSPARAAMQDPVPTTAAVEAAELGGTRNVHRCGDLWFAGQFESEDIALLRKQGIKRVITLRQDGEIAWDEKALVEAAGLEFIALPFREPDTLTDSVFAELRALLANGQAPTLLHCGSANRVGGAWIPYRVLDQGVALEQARREAKAIGLRTEGYEARALAYIETQRASADERASVKPGINDNFKDPELDVAQFLQRFEVESREVYSARAAVLAALEIEPGMRVADVGAGTGLYTFLISEAVGANGWVYAVDIAPRFLQHIFGLAAERNVTNITGVLCPESSTGLAPSSVDLVFVCDTYHHFEYPAATMRSIHRALKPGGRLVVIDFERIEGVTREWLLDHVRAGKDVFRSEIERAGFQLEREIEVAGIEENYVLEFRRPRE